MDKQGMRFRETTRRHACSNEHVTQGVVDHPLEQASFRFLTFDRDTTPVQRGARLVYRVGLKQQAEDRESTVCALISHA